MPTPKRRRSSRNGTRVGEGLDHPPHVVDPQPVSRHERAQPALIGLLPPADGTLEVAEVSLRDRDRLGLVGDATSDDAVRHLHVHRPDLLGRNTAEAAAFHHRRAAHAMLELAVAMTTSQQPRSAALPAKQKPELTPTSGTSPDSRREGLEVGTSSRRYRRVGVARTAAAALVKMTTGSRGARRARAAGLLAVVLRALRAGEDGVVVGEDDAARARVGKCGAVHAADAGHEGRRRARCSGRGPRARAAGAAPRLPAAHTRRTSRVAEVGDVLTRGSLPASAAAARRPRGAQGEPDRVPLFDLA